MPDAVLRTERVVLRPLTAAAAGEFLAGPPDGGFPTPDDRALLTRLAVAREEDIRHSYLLLQDGRPVGTLGVAGGLSPEGDQELSYSLVPAARGRGLATEAVGALAAVLERQHGVRRLTAEVRPGNEASRRLLGRLGFTEVGGGSTGHLLLARAALGEPPVRARFAGRHVC